MRPYTLSEFAQPLDISNFAWLPKPDASDLYEGLVCALELEGRAPEAKERVRVRGEDVGEPVRGGTLSHVEVLFVKIVREVAEDEHNASAQRSKGGKSRASRGSSTKLMVEVVGWLGQSAGSDEEIAMLIGQDKSMMAPVRTKPTQYNDGEWWKNLQDEKTQEEWEKAIDDPSHPFHDEIVACKNVPLTQDQRAFRYDIRRRIRKTLVHPRKEELLKTFPPDLEEVVEIYSQTSLAKSQFLTVGDQITCHAKNFKWIPDASFCPANARFEAGRSRICNMSDHAKYHFMSAVYVGVLEPVQVSYATTWSGKIIEESSASSVRKMLGPRNIVRLLIHKTDAPKPGAPAAEPANKSWGNYYVQILHKGGPADAPVYTGVILGQYLMAPLDYVGGLIRFDWNCVREIPHTWTECNESVRRQVDAQVSNGFGHAVTGGAEAY